MFGTYQSSHLRIELAASADEIKASLMQPKQLERWLWPQKIDLGETLGFQLGTQFIVGQMFESKLGVIEIEHKVEVVTAQGIRFLLSKSIDGFHEWQWGDGWVQSRLEGVSLLPLNLGQTLSLDRLKQHLKQGS